MFNFWTFFLCSLPALCAGAGDDASTGLAERDWFVAADHASALGEYCSSFATARTLKCLDLFSASANIAKTFRKHGHAAVSFDIATNKDHDILSKAGFYQALDWALQLVDEGLLVAGTPCCMWIPISQSVHQRDEIRWWGNVRNYKVRLSNAISENAAALIGLILRWRPAVYIVAEQPKGSLMFRTQYWTRLITQNMLVLILTYLGLFGMDILKPTKLVSNMKTAETLARKATRAVKDKFNARIARKNQKLASKGKPIPQYYTTGKSKTGKKTFTGGKDLHKTASYPLRFCSALYRSWVQAQSSTLTD